MKKIMIIIPLLIAILSACTNKSDEPPTIIVKSGSITLDTTVGKNKWNDAVYDREDTFIVLMKNKEILDLPYINLNEDIGIKFPSGTPDSFTLKDYILNSKGERKYSEEMAIEIPLQFSKKTAVFKLEENKAAFFSSDTSSYERGGIIRGFRLTCTWGANECEYAFILRTDANTKTP